MATTTEFRAANTDSPLRSSFSVSLSSLSKCLLALVSFIYLCEQSRSRLLFYLTLNVSVCEIVISIKRCSTMFIDSRNMRYLFVPGPDSLKIRYWVYSDIQCIVHLVPPRIPIRDSAFMSRSIHALSLIHSNCLPRSRAHATRIDSKGVLQLAPSFIIFRSFHSARWLARIFIGSPLPHQEWVTLFSSEKKILSLGEHVLVHLLSPIALRCMPVIGALP